MENRVELEWRPAELEPAVISEPVLCQTENKKLVVFKDTMGWIVGEGKPKSNWKWLREKYNIKWWVYQIEIMI